jgi:hypothetical protein
MAGLPRRVEPVVVICGELNDPSHSHMQKLRYLGQAVVNLIKQTWLLPKRRRLRAVLNEQEAERLDRIRNPSKYLGR